ncbi:MAG TPA: 3-hydroxyisobutyrate dehydrogenase [Gammaproteobacteria bacterium]|nr:3-hydroxyisobutyrate dehydrogenase [Gammaproteobacteria bacterium]HIK71199.1 3-hydroxyisobutyrate dehydrogenase [Pseudomonadales bacterium]
MKKIGFIGLGNMGGPMASNLLKAQHEVAVYDIVPSLVESISEQGGIACKSAAEVLCGADLVISMLPASQHVESLYLGDEGIMPLIDTSSIVIDCSTISPASSNKVSTAAQALGIAMLDAPVSGGVGGAVAGSLTFIVGGTEADLEKVRPILEIMGNNIFHAGAAGAGQVAKICNNMLLSVLMTGTAEALQLGVNNGLDAKVLSEIMRKSSGGNWALEVYNPYPGVMDNVPAGNDYQGGFLVDLMIKDLGLAMESALATDSSIPLGALARNLYRLHGSKGAGGKDFSSIQQLFTTR